MGSAQSYISSESAIASLFVAGAVAYGYTHYGAPTADTEVAPAALPGKRKKKKQAASAGELHGASTSQADAPIVVPFPPVIPGDFDPAPAPVPADAAALKPVKKKKAKKAGALAGGAPRTQPADAMSESSATAPESSVRPAKAKKGAAQKPPPIPPVEADEHWTRVESRRRAAAPQGPTEDGPAAAGASAESRLEVSTSDAGLTTSVTGTSSPVTERTEDEVPAVERSTAEKRRTLAEKLLPKPRKTGVDDMLETSDYPTVARVMRIQPGPNEQPAAGFSWGDYEDVDESRATADDADGEDDGGWGVVKSRGRAKTSKTQSQQTAPPAPETLTKRQRQNAAKREAQKAAKGDAEADRQARLAQHHRELEREKIAALYGRPANAAYVDNKGKLVFD